MTGVTADGSHVRLLGGNQNDAVNETWFPSTRITAYRLPPGIAVLSPAKISQVGALSTSEA